MAGAFVAGKFFSGYGRPNISFKNDIPDPDQETQNLFTRKGAWGELLEQNIKLERPIEYLAKEAKNPPPEAWTFSKLDLEQIKALLGNSGLLKEQVNSVMAAGNVNSSGSNIVVMPGEDFLLSLSPETRKKLYDGLSGLGAYVYIDFPYLIPRQTLEAIYSDKRLRPDDLAILKKLVYPDGNATRLTDYNLLLRKIPTVERRISMAKALSMQPAVLARICVRPDTDIEKIANYWGHMDNVHFDDIRPLLEALKALPKGGTVSLVYFMPPFARQRLYTYPLRDQAGYPVMDCHWSTFNFSRIESDNRFNDTVFLVDYIKKNYYQIENPSVYGDILLFVNDKNQIRHSAVYLADDLAFTKYGNNYMQPWMIVRIADMQTMYPTLRPIYCRQKTD